MKMDKIVENERIIIPLLKNFAEIRENNEEL
jgi:hypothetical protein